MINDHKKKLIRFGVFVLVILFLSYKLFEIPAGFFGDEALIGVRASEVMRGDFSHFYNLFTYDHFRYVLGTLPIFSLVPFVGLFGLSESSVRVGVLFYSFISLYVLYQILRELKAKNALLVVCIYASTPLFFHFARINFGQIPSLLFVLLGYYFYLQIKKKLHFAIISGIFFGISGYGLGANIIATPLFLFIILFFDVFYSKFDIRKITPTIIVCMVFFITYLPLFHSFATNPNFLHRLQDKNQGTLRFVNSDKLINIVRNYPKYFSYDYLFSKGENDISGAFISRHAIRGVGVLSKMLLPVIVCGFFLFLFFSAKHKKQFAPFFILFLLYPFPDIITTTKDNAPYSVVLFSTLICIPFITSYTIDAFSVFFEKKLPRVFFISTLFVLVVFEVFLLIRAFDAYRSYSAGYWGWQSGPREIIAYFKTQANNYDELYMSGMFNEPQVFLQFYDNKRECNNCFIGGIDRYEPHKKQLFALTQEEYIALKSARFTQKHIVYYPDNTVAFRIGEYNP